MKDCIQTSRDSSGGSEVVSIYSLARKRRKGEFVVTGVAFGNTLNAVMPIIADIEATKSYTAAPFIAGLMFCGCAWIALPGPTIFGAIAKSIAEAVVLLVPGVVLSCALINGMDYFGVPTVQESIKLAKKAISDVQSECPADKLFTVIRHDLKMLYGFCANEILLEECHKEAEKAFSIYKDHYISTHSSGAAVPPITIDLACCTLDWLGGEVDIVYLDC